VIDVESFRAYAVRWLAENRVQAPRDYGAILPPDQREEGQAWQRRIYDGGFAGIHWPTEYGGRGLTPEHTGAWIEQCALASVPPFINMVGIVLAGGSLLLYGTDAQKAEHLQPIITGERVWCQLFSEPGAGSDLASLTTRADRDGDEYAITGQKVWCSNGRISDWGICLARTRGEGSASDEPHSSERPRSGASESKHHGISFFLVDMHLAGIDVRPLRQMTGGADFDEVFLDNVRVPASCLLGPENEGWKVGMATLTNERGHIGASTISLQRRLDGMAALGGGLDAVHRDELTALVARGRTYLALAQRQGAVASVAASLMKLGVTEMLFDVAVLRTELAGADGMLMNDAALGVLAAPAGRIAGGTTQVQRNIIGERILGLPKEPR
jgi:alkylation response protein AidB-like acyl-CoA dehydrogenase